MSLAIYYVGFVLLSIAALVSISQEGKRYCAVLLVFVSIALILFAGLRGGSPDQQTYAIYFNAVAPLEDVLIGKHNYDEVYGEWGFLFLSSIIKFFSSNEIIMFIIVAFISVSGVAYSCKCISPYPLISILCYYSWFYYSNMGALRHALSSSLILLLIVAIAKYKNRLAIPILFSAVSIHSVSISAISLWFTRMLLRWRIPLVLLIIIVCFICYRGGIGIELSTKLLPYSNDYLHKKYDFYLQSDLWGVKEAFARGVVIKQLLITSVFICYFEKFKKRFPEFPVVFGAYLISTIILLLFIDFKILSNRVSNLLAISEIILIPMLFSLIPKREKIAVFFILVPILFFQFNKLVGVQFYPYKFVL